MLYFFILENRTDKRVDVLNKDASFFFDNFQIYMG